MNPPRPPLSGCAATALPPAGGFVEFLLCRYISYHRVSLREHRDGGGARRETLYRIVPSRFERREPPESSTQTATAHQGPRPTRGRRAGISQGDAALCRSSSARVVVSVGASKEISQQPLCRWVGTLDRSPRHCRCYQKYRRRRQCCC